MFNIVPDALRLEQEITGDGSAPLSAPQALKLLTRDSYTDFKKYQRPSLLNDSFPITSQDHFFTKIKTKNPRYKV